MRSGNAREGEHGAAARARAVSAEVPAETGAVEPVDSEEEGKRRTVRVPEAVHREPGAEARGSRAARAHQERADPR